jgi:hypothetical protein
MFDADAAQALDSAVNLFQEISRLNMAARYSKVIYIINDDLCYTWMPIFFSYFPVLVLQRINLHIYFTDQTLLFLEKVLNNTLGLCVLSQEQNNYYYLEAPT